MKLPRMFSSVLMAALGGLPVLAHAELTLPALFADGAVLQRDVSMPVWGWATSGARVEVEFDGAKVSTMADAQGRWRVELPHHGAGGPYRLSVSADGHVMQVDDVLVGDVWLASGQSNMEFKLAQARDAAQEIAAANDSKLRDFKVPQAWAAQPREHLPGGHWMHAVPKEAGEFTAVGYFFARALRRSTEVPIGIIDSSWGGSAIEAWMSAGALGMDEQKTRERMAQIKAEDARIEARTQARVDRFPKPEKGDTKAWRQRGFDDSGWDRLPVAQAWEPAGYDGMNGLGWYRTTFTLSKAEASAGVTLGIGQVDDSDTTWVNGELVGATENAWNIARVYRVPASVLRAGVNQIAIRVDDLGGGGGLHGPASSRFVQLADGSRHALAAQWRFRPGKVSVSLSDDKNQKPTLLYNAMIHPLQAFPVKGVIWYQGETNATEQGAFKYREQFAGLIGQWRGDRAQARLPFLWVQLANFKAGGDRGDFSAWALLRESQSATLSLSATGQAVIIDIGNPEDIHPTNKQDVGHRLALIARHVAYGESLVYSAPVFKQARFDAGVAELHFDPMGSRLAVRGGGGRAHGFQLAGADHIFHPAMADVTGSDTVRVHADAVPKPVAVRYGWSENPTDADLINPEKLPVSPFRSDTW